MVYRFLAIFLLMLFAHSSHGRAICGDTISIQMNGRDTCASAGSGDWDGLFNVTKESMKKAAGSNSSVVQQLSRSHSLNKTNSQCNRAAMYVSGGTQVTVRCPASKPASTYAITMVHELCHVASHAPAPSGGTYLSKFNSMKINCSGISPYARCGSRNEMFAETCTAFLRAPQRIQSGCTNPGQAEQFFKEMFQGADGKNSCANTVTDPETGQSYDGTVPPQSPQQFAKKDQCGANDGDEYKRQSSRCRREEKKEMDDVKSVCANPNHKYYREDFCKRLNAQKPSGFRAAPGKSTNASSTSGGYVDQVSASPGQSAAVSATFEDSVPADSGARETLSSGTRNAVSSGYNQLASGDRILGTTEAKSAISADAKAEEYWDNFFESADDVEGQKLAEQNALAESGLAKAGYSDAAARSPAKAQKLEGPDYQGMTLKAVDGMTGPFGRTIWTKINQSYEAVTDKWHKEDQYLRDNFDGSL